MRVTNEQAKDDIQKYRYHSETKTRVSPLVKKNYDYAADLLEARGLINEMREVLEEIIQQNICEPCCMSGSSRCNTCEGSCDVVRDHKELLERTKEYAE